MEVSVQSLAQAAEAESAGQRPLGNSLSQGNANSNGQVVTFSQAYPNISRPEHGRAVGAIDKLRNDFMSFQSRILTPGTAPVDGTYANQPAIQAMRDTMDRAVGMQAGLFQLSVSLNVGLTATQQSQSSVKTLIEKS